MIQEIPTRQRRGITLTSPHLLDSKLNVGPDCRFKTLDELLAATSLLTGGMVVLNTTTGIKYTITQEGFLGPTVEGGEVYLAFIEDFHIVGYSPMITYRYKEDIPTDNLWGGLHVYDQDAQKTYLYESSVWREWGAGAAVNFIEVTADYTFDPDYNWHHCIPGNSDFTITVDVDDMEDSVEYTFRKTDDEYGTFTLVDSSAVELYVLEVEGETVVLNKIDDEIVITFK
jgi:hypothetical protein